MNVRMIRPILLVLVPSLVVADAARAEIVGWWKCDEGSGTVARDSSRYGNDVFFQGDPQWVAGHFKGGLEFDGAGDYLDRGVYAPSLDIVGTVTVTAWVKPGVVARDHEICGNVTTGPNGGGYMLGIYSNDRVELKVWSSAGSSLPGNHPAGGVGLQAGTWYFLAGTYAETADGPIIRTYVNGVLDQELISPVVMAPSSGTFKIGRDPAAPGLGEFVGVIDDVRVYNQVLTENALQDVMLGKRPPSKVAVAPLPQDEQTDVPRDVVLGWTPGDYARTHDVYFGTAFADVNGASRSNPLGVLVSQGQDANTYAPPEALTYGQTCFWRIDEVNAPPDATIQRGDVWRFTTETMVYAIPRDKITATASSSQDGGPAKTIDGSGLVNDLHSVDTKAMWLSGAGDPGSAWIRYDFDRAYKLERMSVWNYNGPLLLAGFGIKDATIEYSPDGVAWTALPGTNAFAKATGKDGYVCNTTVELGGVMAKSVRITAVSNWGGSFFRQYGLSEVRFLYTPVQARYPSPDSGATGVAVDVTLSWRVGREAAQHDLYLSTDEQSVQDGTAPVTTLSQTSHGPLSLDLGQRYYWKVNEVNAVETPATVEGDVWSFSTAEYLVVDDFESYNDQESTGTRIYETWIDGWTDSQKGGSQVGYTDPTFVEQTIVHGGRQSMPLSYDNTGGAGYSEAELPLASEDWTRAGITALVLYFHGAPANSGGQLYVKINGVKVPFQGSTDAIKRPAWTQWNIDLAAVGGNLQSVRTLSIGIDGTGATGILYVDDIRLYVSAPAPASEEIWIEAEAANTISAPLQVFSTIPGASGGQYIEVETGNSSIDAPPTQGIATYKFTVQGGTYRIRGRVMTSGDADSFWLRLQGATTQTKNHASGWVRWNGLQDGDWHWEDVYSSDDGNQIVLFTMKPGTYTLEVAYREETSLLDALMIIRAN